MSSFSRQALVVFTVFWKNMMANIKPWLQFVKWYLEAIMNGRGNYQEKVMTNCRAPFSQRSVNLNWPTRAQSGTCSSRFQTAVDVEHGSRMFVLPHGRILSKLSTTKNGLGSPWGFYIMGNLSCFMEIWFLWWFVAPYRDERVFCEVGSLRTIVRVGRIAGLPLCSERGTTTMGKSSKTASNRPQTTYKTQWQPHVVVDYFYFNISAHILPFWNILQIPIQSFILKSLAPEVPMQNRSV